MTLSTNQQVVIVPFGEFSHPVKNQVVDKGAVERIMNRLQEWNRDIVVDYQHESMKQCGRAPAAGWVKKGTAGITENGIEAVIEWTDKASRLIEKKEYRYLSPVFEYQNGMITGLVNLGLTNNPNIHVMEPLANQYEPKEINMENELIVRLKEILGLEDENDDADLVIAVESLIEKNSQEPDLVSLLGNAIPKLGLTPEATTDEIIEKINELSTEAVAGKDENIERLVNEAVSAGKLRPNLKSWARDLAQKSPESFRMFLINSGPVAPLGTALVLGCLERKSLSESESNVCQSLNISEEDYVKYGN